MLQSASAVLRTKIPLKISGLRKASQNCQILDHHDCRRFERRATGIRIRRFSTSLPPFMANVEVTIEHGVRTIRLNRPEKKNALTKDMGHIIVTALQESNSDDATVLTVITGEGDYFTSGIDLSSMKPPTDSKTQPPPKPAKAKSLALFTTLIDLQKPLIALVNGHAIGVGVTMLGLCDAVYCSDKATFQTRFTQFGLTPDSCSTYTFPRIMGYAKSNEMLVRCKKFTAAEALESGLVSHVYPDSGFRSEAWKKIRELAALPVKSLIYTKELVRGRERSLLHDVHRQEQERFDIDAAIIVKKMFAQRKLKMEGS